MYFRSRELRFKKKNVLFFDPPRLGVKVGRVFHRPRYLSPPRRGGERQRGSMENEGISGGAREGEKVLGKKCARIYRPSNGETKLTCAREWRFLQEPPEQPSQIRVSPPSEGGGERKLSNLQEGIRARALVRRKEVLSPPIERSEIQPCLLKLYKSKYRISSYWSILLYKLPRKYGEFYLGKRVTRTTYEKPIKLSMSRFLSNKILTSYYKNLSGQSLKGLIKNLARNRREKEKGKMLAYAIEQRIDSSVQRLLQLKPSSSFRDKWVRKRYKLKERYNVSP